MDSKHIGMGLVLCENVFSLDKELFFDYISWLKEEDKKTFTYYFHGQSEYALNRAGFKFDIKEVSFAPNRLYDLSVSQSNRLIPKEFLEILEILEQSIYDVLVEYCCYFPECAKTSWWRPHGHIAEYYPNQQIGTHCDNQLPFEWGKHVERQSSLYNTCSVNLYLNDCVDDISSINDYEYTGGHFLYPNADWEWKPKSGCALIYPSNYIGLHSVLPVQNGIRYSYLANICQGTSFEYPEKVGEENPQKIWMSSLTDDFKKRISTKEFKLR